MTSIPRECAEARADFIEHALTPRHVRFLDEMTKSSRRLGDNMLPYDYDGRDLAEDMQHIAMMAEMWTGTPDMLGLIGHAAKSLPPEGLYREQVPSQQGFLYLPQPLMLTDVRGLPLPIHGIMWSERTIGRDDENPGGGVPNVTRGLIVFMLTRNGSPEDQLRATWSTKQIAKMTAGTPVLSLVHAMSIAYGHVPWDVDTSMVDGPPEVKAEVARRAMRSAHDVIHHEPDADGGYRVTTSDGHVVRAVPDATTQFLKAYFHFVGSELSAIDREYLPRSSAKWLRRLGLVNDPISVVRLRRRKQGNETGRGGVLSYRHVRRGHWRKQWYGSGEARFQQHIWISPTIVGPADGELRVRDVVNLAQF